MGILTDYQNGQPDIKELISAEVLDDTRYMPFFEGMVSNTGDGIIYTKTNFSKGDGDKINFTLIQTNEHDMGVTGKETLEGKENRISRATDSLEIERRRNAFEWDVDDVEMFPNYNIPTIASKKLSHWSSQLRDYLIWSELKRDLTNQTIFSNDKPNLSSLVPEDKLTVDELYKLRARALDNDDISKPALSPLMIDGEEHFILLVDEFVAYDLQTNGTYIEYVKLARERAKTNPLFTGALAIINGIIIKTHQGVGRLQHPNGFKYSKNILLGKNALGLGFGKPPKVVELKKDYDAIAAVSLSMYFGVKRLEFDYTTDGSPDNSKKYAVGVNHLITACSDLS